MAQYLQRRHQPEQWQARQQTEVQMKGIHCPNLTDIVPFLIDEPEQMRHCGKTFNRNKPHGEPVAGLHSPVAMD
jgi:hypothetical protein